jgi:MOSC domain-containing protein YiiM
VPSIARAGGRRDSDAEQPLARVTTTEEIPEGAVKEAPLPSDLGLTLDAASLLACLATILEIPVAELPIPARDEDPAGGRTLQRWLGGLGLGLVPVADAATFSWPGPWIARMAGRYVVMFGVPSGVVWDPAADTEAADNATDAMRPGRTRTAERRSPGVPAGRRMAAEETPQGPGYVVAASDIALAMPPRAEAPATAGTVELIAIAPHAGAPVTTLATAMLRAGQGVHGDRHTLGTGTFPSGLPGSALTLIEAEVCESFEPPLGPGEHRRNVVVRGIDLTGLVGCGFTIGTVRCRGRRLCEPCTVVQGYAGRPVLRALVHRGGLRADILTDGEISVGDTIRCLPVRCLLGPR